MQIEDNKVVTLEYTLTVNGDLVDQSGDRPLTYLHGHRNMITGFEKNLIGLESGSDYEFDVVPAEGYGELNQDAIMDLDKSIFLVDGVMSNQVFEGAQLQMTNQNGQPIQGTVVEITEEKVKMDFNHPLAGQTLHFTGKILEIRDASPEEIEHGHVHEPGGHHH